MIITLDEIPEQSIPTIQERTPLPSPPVELIHPNSSFEPKNEKDRKELLIRQIEEKEAYIRHQRAMLHREYRAMVNEKMEPIASHEEFIEQYEKIEAFTQDLRRLWIKKEQIIKTGAIHPQKILTDQDLAKISALKHARSRVNDNLYRARKKLEMATNTGNLIKEKNASDKIIELELKYLEISQELKALEDAK
jgi:hypothetical protein